MSKYNYLHALYQALLPLDVEQRNTIMRDIENQFRNAEENGIDEKNITDKLGTPTDYAKHFLTQIGSANVTDERADLSKEVLSSIHPGPSKPGRNDEPTHFDEPTHIQEPTHTQEPLNFHEPQYIENQNVDKNPIFIEESKIQKEKLYTSPNVILSNRIAANPIQLLLVGFGMMLFNMIVVLGPFIGLWALVFAFVTTGLALFISGLIVIISGLLTVPFSFVIVPLVVINHPVLLFSFGFLITGLGGLLTIVTIYMIRFFGRLTARYVSWNVKIIRGY